MENQKLQDLEKIFKAGGDAVCLPNTKPQTLTEFLDKNEDLAFRLGAVIQLKFDKMEKFEIHIDKIYDLESKIESPKQTIIITREQFAIIERFADTRKDKYLNTIYRLNQCEFKVMPHFDFGNDK